MKLKSEVFGTVFLDEIKYIKISFGFWTDIKGIEVYRFNVRHFREVGSWIVVSKVLI